MLNFHATKGRVAVHLDSFQLPITHEEAIDILTQKGFILIDVQLDKIADSLKRKTDYRRGATFSETPHVFDCSLFVKWIFAQRGILIPRRTIQQLRFGESVEFEEIKPWDILLFESRTGRNYYLDEDHSICVGHAALVAGEDKLLHVVKKWGVVESPVNNYAGKLRAARRIMPEKGAVYTFAIPSEMDIDMSDDLRWIILQNLHLVPLENESIAAG